MYKGIISFVRGVYQIAKKVDYQIREVLFPAPPSERELARRDKDYVEERGRHILTTEEIAIKREKFLSGRS